MCVHHTKIHGFIPIVLLSWKELCLYPHVEAEALTFTEQSQSKIPAKQEWRKLLLHFDRNMAEM